LQLLPSLYSCISYFPPTLQLLSLSYLATSFPVILKLLASYLATPLW
jgi:hypothetical protein